MPWTALPSVVTHPTVCILFLIRVTMQLTLLYPQISGGWQWHWLQSRPCSPPCWEGITPGQTTAQQALPIIQQLSFVKNTRLYSSDPNPIFRWDWADSNKGGGEIAFSDSSITSTVRYINLTMPDRIRFSDVIHTYNNPSHVAAEAVFELHEEKVFYTLDIFYSGHGFALLGGDRTTDFNHKPVFDQNTKFDTVIFFSKSTDLATNFPYLSTNPQIVTQWNGFKGFDFYCRDRAAGKACMLNNSSSIFSDALVRLMKQPALLFSSGCVTMVLFACILIILLKRKKHNRIL